MFEKDENWDCVEFFKFNLNDSIEIIFEKFLENKEFLE